MIGTPVNEEHTKEESRTWSSEYQVNDYIPLIAFNVCSLGLCLFFLNLNNKPDKETLWANQKQRN